MLPYKRTIYLVNPKFQIKFSLFVSTLICACGLVYPIVIYETYDRLIEQAGNSELAHILIGSKSDILQFLILFQVIFMSLAFIICIFQSHKIAGPLYKLREYLRQVQSGQLNEKIYFRKGDNFHEIAKDYNLAIEAINRSMIKKDKGIEELKKYLSENLSKENDEQKKIYSDLLQKASNI